MAMKGWLDKGTSGKGLCRKGFIIKPIARASVKDRAVGTVLSYLLAVRHRQPHSGS